MVSNKSNYLRRIRKKQVAVFDTFYILKSLRHGAIKYSILGNYLTKWRAKIEEFGMMEETNGFGRSVKADND